MLGILGGSFDPIHCGHLRLAVELQHGLGLSEIRLIPCGVPPHRAPLAASGAQRLAMLKAAVQGEPGLVVDERELQRAGPSYTVDTLASLRAEVGKDVPLCLVMGKDAFIGLHTWHRWHALIGIAHIVVAERPGCGKPVEGEVAQLLATHRVEGPESLRKAPAGCILPWPVPALDISSSRIRALCAEGRSIRYLVPDTVMEILQAQRIYQSDNKEVYT